MFFLIPLNAKIFSLLQQIRRKKVKVTDTRVKLMNEILSGIRVLKYYAWERAFSEKVEIVREEELNLLKQLAYVVAIGFTLVLMSAPIVQPILIFFTYIQLGNTLDAATAFTTISLFNVMQFPFAFLPMGIAQYSQVSWSHFISCHAISCHLVFKVDQICFTTYRYRCDSKSHNYYLPSIRYLYSNRLTVTSEFYYYSHWYLRREC